MRGELELDLDPTFVIADPDPQSIFTGLNYNRFKFKMDSGSEAGMTENLNWIPPTLRRDQIEKLKHEIFYQDHAKQVLFLLYHFF